jgi:hypothetical protein
MLKQGKTKKWYATHFFGLMKLDDGFLVALPQEFFEVDPPISFSDDAEIITKIRKDLNLPENARVEVFMEKEREDGLGMKVIRIDPQEGMTFGVAIFYYVEDEGEERKKRAVEKNYH